MWICPTLSIYTWSPVTINFSGTGIFLDSSLLLFCPGLCTIHVWCLLYRMCWWNYEEAIVSPVCFTYI